MQRWLTMSAAALGRAIAKGDIDPVDLAQIPRFNESEGHGPKRLHPVEDYFDDLSKHLMWEIYKRDFQLFKYDFDNPANKMPLAEVDLDEVHAKLGD